MTTPPEFEHDPEMTLVKQLRQLDAGDDVLTILDYCRQAADRIDELHRLIFDITERHGIGPGRDN
jgi:hypothetical protein